MQSTTTTSTRRPRRWLPAAAAAAVLVLGGVTGAVILTDDDPPTATAPGPTMQLALPDPGTMSSCIRYSVDVGGCTSSTVGTAAAVGGAPT